MIRLTKGATGTFQTRIDEAVGTPAGFDYMRLVLALSVVVSHTVVTSYGMLVHAKLWFGPMRPILAVLLPMFFALSGFLVGGSLDRCRTLIGFLTLRVLRIVPALAVEVVVSALLLGPFVTDLPLASYFSNMGFFAYFLNIVGDIHYNLPEAFSGNPLPLMVNGQLWTVPYELESYIVLAVLAIFGLHRNRIWFLTVVILFQFACIAESFLPGAPIDAGWSVPGRILVLTFLAGVGFHLYRDKVVHLNILAVLSAFAVFELLLVPRGSYFVAFPAAYLTVYLGVLNPRRNKFLRSGDYSYGIYLYSFPVQQTVAFLGPAFHHWVINLVCSVPVAWGIAFISWHCVEKRALKLRRYIPSLENAGYWRRLPRWSRFQAAAQIR